MEIEQEIKFSLLPEHTGELLQSPRVRGAALGNARCRRVRSTYFDTRNHSLRKAGAALRVRSDGAGFEQTLKIATAGPSGIQNCEEWTVALDSAEPSLRAFDREVLRRFKHRGRKLKLIPLFTTDVERTSRLLQYGETSFEMSLDRGRIEGHGSTAHEIPVCEVEFELVRGELTDILGFLLDIVDEVELRPLFPSKAQRGYALVRPALKSTATRAGKVRLDKRMSALDAFRVIAGDALTHLLSNAEAVDAGHAEALHQSRVAIRRIRAALGAFGPVLPRSERREFNDRFRFVQSGLSPARDWHVFDAESLPQFALDAGAGRETLKRLKNLARRERDKAMRKALATLHSPSSTALLLQFQRWLLFLESAKPERGAGKLKPFAKRALDSSRRALLMDARPLKKMKEEERHALRKRGKKARYATEFFAGLWQGPEVTRYLKVMARLQDQLGVANDAVVARHLLETAEPGHLRDSDAAAVKVWARAREQQCIATAQPVWRRAQKLRPFWS